METYFSFRMKSNSRSVIELKTIDRRGYAFIEPYLFPSSKQRLPEDVMFTIVKGNRHTDIIVYNESASINFYSQKLIDILGQFADVSKICYPIRINNCKSIYYAIYNLEGLEFLNQSDFLHNPLFLMREKIPMLFTLTGSNFKICSSIIKEAFIKKKLSNVYYRDVYGISSMEEYYELKKEGRLMNIS